MIKKKRRCKLYGETSSECLYLNGEIKPQQMFYAKMMFSEDIFPIEDIRIKVRMIGVLSRGIQ